jgi:hypothetical protein
LIRKGTTERMRKNGRGEKIETEENVKGRKKEKEKEYCTG